MHYYSVEEARQMPGVRLVLTAGVAGPFCEAVKSMFQLKGISYIPVAQYVGEENRELVAWTGLRNAPIVVSDSQRPVDRWLDILNLVERMAPQPQLLPDDSEQRALVVGMCNEICGEWSLGWARRVMFLASSDDASTQSERLRANYSVTPDAAKRAPARIAAVLAMLAKRLSMQRARGASYLVGDGFTAADLYWAHFSIALKPLPEEVSPMPQYQRQLYETSTPEMEAAKDPILFEHRDMIFGRYLTLPLDF